MGPVLRVHMHVRRVHVGLTRGVVTHKFVTQTLHAAVLAHT